MNKFKILILLLSLLLFSNFHCRKAVAPLPSCIDEEIKAAKAKLKANPPITITEYEYKGQRVYFISSECCDQYNRVVNAQCELICAPSGGITGKGDGKCADFNNEAKLVREVWSDSR
jgi:hypothetical protein